MREGNGTCFLNASSWCASSFHRFTRERTYKESGFKAAVKTLAQESLKQLNERTRRGEYIPAMDFARLFVRLGDRDQAFVCLEKAGEERNGLVFYLKHDPAFDSLRDDPRFEAVLRRVGLPR